MSAQVSPSEADLKAALVLLKSESPGLGIGKTHALLLSVHPEWMVSEKRTRKILQAEGLVASAPGETGRSQIGSRIYPSSRMIDNLDVKKWTPKVEVKYFNKVKGKGLVAEEDIKEGEVIWKEDPWIIAAEWEISDLQRVSRYCAHCTTPLSNPSRVVECPNTPCSARYCNRLCLSRAAATHPLLCTVKNPAAADVQAFARRCEWLALQALCECTAKILLASQHADQKELDAAWNAFRGFAVLGMEDRFKDFKDEGIDDIQEPGRGEPDRETWTKAYKLYVQAFQGPIDPAHLKKFQKILRKPVPTQIADELFPYEGFLRGLGRMSLNLEAHGGLYTLHSHVNHSCTPNVSVRHLEQRTALARITLLARADIPRGGELFITYVNPALGVRARRRALAEWGFGQCDCRRCVEEEREEHEEPRGEGDLDLERELRAGLGVV